MASLPPIWEQEYGQLGHGTFDGRMFLAHTSRVQFAVASWRPGILIRGSPPPGCTLLALLLWNQGPCSHRGMKVDCEHLGVMHDYEGVDFRTSHPCGAFMLAAPRALIEEHARVILGRSIEELRRDGSLALNMTGAELFDLRDLGAAYEKRLLHDPAQLRRAHPAREFENTLLHRLLTRVRAPEIQINRSYRRSLAWRTEQYLREHLSETINVYDACLAIGAAERTLHLAFVEEFGTTPKAYLKMLRLNAVRRDLRNAGPEENVTRVAMRWGFNHLGWFSKDYAEMFGESPRVALAHAR